MSEILLKLSRVIEVVSAFVLIAGLVVAPANLSFADGEYDANPCKNGGGGMVTCKSDTEERKCTNGTAGLRCDAPITCTCKVLSGGSNPCTCAN